MIELEVNGEPKKTDATTVATLIEELGLAGQAVAVELNHAVVPRQQHAETEINSGDKIELVTLVGGG
ncbi:MAG: sulfur carrier protein ThiS [Phycisphaeraceae bacterium]